MRVSAQVQLFKYINATRTIFRRNWQSDGLNFARVLALACLLVVCVCAGVLNSVMSVFLATEGVVILAYYLTHGNELTPLQQVRHATPLQL